MHCCATHHQPCSFNPPHCTTHPPRYVFLWLLPDNQSFVLGVAGGVTAVSDLFVLLAVFMHDELHLPITYFFIFMGCAAWVVAAVMWLVRHIE